MSKWMIALIVLGVILFAATMFIGVDALMCEPPCV
jgi:preprotein translocase subunit SecE